MPGAGDIRAGRAVVEVAIDPAYQRGLARVKGDFDTLGNRIDAIKARFGSRGLLKDVTELAVGGGAVAGIGFLAATVERTAAAAADLATKFREGKVAAADMGAELLKSLPVIGSLASAIENVADLLTGVKSATAKTLSDAAAQDAETANRAARVGIRRNISEGLDNATIQDLISSLGGQGNQYAAARGAELSRQAAATTATDAFEKQIATLLPGLSPGQADLGVTQRIADLRSRQQALRRRIQSGPDLVPVPDSAKPLGDSASDRLATAGLMMTDQAVGSIGTSSGYQALLEANRQKALRQNEEAQKKFAELQTQLESITSVLKDVDPLFEQFSKRLAQIENVPFLPNGQDPLQASIEARLAATAPPYLPFGQEDAALAQNRARLARRTSGVPFLGDGEQGLIDQQTGEMQSRRRIKAEIDADYAQTVRGNAKLAERIQRAEQRAELVDQLQQVGYGVDSAYSKNILKGFDAITAAKGQSIESRSIFDIGQLQSLQTGGGDSPDVSATKETTKAVRDLITLLRQNPGLTFK
jgi:hypothetical protein